jgi:hypothetical protein
MAVETLTPPPDMFTSISKGWFCNFTRDNGVYTLRMLKSGNDFTETGTNIWDICCAMIKRIEAA